MMHCSIHPHIHTHPHPVENREYICVLNFSVSACCVFQKWVEPENCDCKKKKHEREEKLHRCTHNNWTRMSKICKMYTLPLQSRNFSILFGECSSNKQKRKKRPKVNESAKNEANSTSWRWAQLFVGAIIFAWWTLIFNLKSDRESQVHIFYF